MSPEKKTWIFLSAVIVAESAPFWFRAFGKSWSQIVHNLFLSNPGRPEGWGMALAFALLFIVGSARRNYDISENLLKVNAMKLAVIPMAAISGIVEEVYFRRVTMETIARRGGGLLLQIVAAAVIFGLLHMVWALAGSVRAGIQATLATTLLGWAMALVYLAGGRSVAPCIAAHALINLVLEPWLFLSAARRWSTAEGNADAAAV